MEHLGINKYTIKKKNQKKTKQGKLSISLEISNSHLISHLLSATSVIVGIMTLYDITKGIFTPQNAFLGTHFLKSEATQGVRRTFPIPPHPWWSTGLVLLQKGYRLGGFSLTQDLSAPQRSEITRGYQMIIGHYSSPFRLRSACHLALVVMLMRGIPSLSPHAPCLTFMGLKSSEWWSASVWDSKLHRFNWEESSPWVCWEVPVGWPWTEQHVVHPYKKKKEGKNMVVLSSLWCRD